MPGNTELLGQSILSLLLVLALIIGLLYASKWFMQRRPRGGRRLRFIEAMALSNKEKLVLIEVDNRHLLIGVSPQQVSLLTELDANFDSEDLASTTPVASPNLFAKVLGRQPSSSQSNEESS